MSIQEYRNLYKRELEKLKIEVKLYNYEMNIWVIENRISNSTGNLCLHLIGNLNHFIGFALGKSDYVRNRENEFTLKFIPLNVILSEIDKTMMIVDITLQSITEEQLKCEYPIAKFEEKVSIEYLLSHLLIHFSYHLGQINYHRRLIEN